MRQLGSFLVWLLSAFPVFSATFGTVVPIVGGGADIVLDEPRNRLYLVNSSLNEIDVYMTNVNPPRLQQQIRSICRQPVAAAMSLDRNSLYITCFTDSSMVILNLNTLSGVRAVSLPASPEGIAVGGDGRALITTIGTGQGR